ncbi:MAG TPA: hypothetical protein VFR02_07815 [bacterium]|nr:hypothetical protein [bacterium]
MPLPRKPSHRPALASAALALLLFGSPVQAGEVQWKRSPIQTQASFWGLEYRLAGDPLKDFQDFSDAMTPLGDTRVDRLLARSQDSALWARLGSLVGGVGLGWGGFHLLFDDSPSRHGANTAILLTGVGVDLLASLFSEDSQAAKYNAVQRYNQVVRGEDDSLPPAPKDDKGLLPPTQ